MSVKFSGVAEKFGLTSKELRELVIKHNLPIKGSARVLTSDEVDLIEKAVKKEEKEKSRLAGKAKKEKEEKQKKEEKEEDEEEQELNEEKKEFIIPPTITVKALSEKINLPSSEIIQKLISYGVMANLNQEIDFDTAEIVLEDLGLKAVWEKTEREKLADVIKEEEGVELSKRPPVVTVMGHVDHGKTTLLDAIREANVVKSEAGGITQRIGAYQVAKGGKKITFLDTPGHEAFTKMRARGAQVTDLAVLVVAADDGVMPQTEEAIEHAKAAGIPLLIAINKIDKAGADPEKVKRELADHNILVEDWGGDIPSVEVSAIKKQGLDELLDMILLVSEMEELKANFSRPGVGTIVDAELDEKRGAAATVLMKTGVMETGDNIWVGDQLGKVKIMEDSTGSKVEKVNPSDAVRFWGLNDVPSVGDVLRVIKEGEEKEVSKKVEKLQLERRKERLGSRKVVTLSDLSEKIKKGEVQKLNLVLRADSRGSLEAVVGSLKDLSTDYAEVNIVFKGVGEVNESDVMLASASEGIIIGFNVGFSSTVVENSARREGVEVRSYRIIYKLLEDVEKVLKGLELEGAKEEKIGELLIKGVFASLGNGYIIGGEVIEGYLVGDLKVKVFRNDNFKFEGRIQELKQGKNAVPKVKKGEECGLKIVVNGRVQVGDRLEVWGKVLRRRSESG